ncbi:hypothetical protein B0H10DRAFT_1999628 [Mycena sp. CBHHK59/15]|nr:hypothetical protein B0H10DRAFT_1999628 [Mycena sp. CBHHK59/15]
MALERRFFLFPPALCRIFWLFCLAFPPHVALSSLSIAHPPQPPTTTHSELVYLCVCFPYLTVDSLGPAPIPRSLVRAFSGHRSGNGACTHQSKQRRTIPLGESPELVVISVTQY